MDGVFVGQGVGGASALGAVCIDVPFTPQFDKDSPGDYNVPIPLMVQEVPL